MEQSREEEPKRMATGKIDETEESEEARAQRAEPSSMVPKKKISGEAMGTTRRELYNLAQEGKYICELPDRRVRTLATIAALMAIEGEHHQIHVQEAQKLQRYFGFELDQRTKNNEGDRQKITHIRKKPQPREEEISSEVVEETRKRLVELRRKADHLYNLTDDEVSYYANEALTLFHMSEQHEALVLHGNSAHKLYEYFAFEQRSRKVGEERVDESED